MGNEGEPVALRTKIRWIVRGVIQPGSDTIRARTHTVFGSTEETSLAGAVRRFCDTEDFGTEHTTGCLSTDDQRAITLLEKGTRKLDVGYEVPITWKEGEPSLPNNRPLAERRFNSLLRRFDSDSAFENDYRAAMEKNFTQGYAAIVKEDPASSADEYFLAHHGVYKGPKLRVVFDAAARYRGKCLNDSILSGPASQTPLPAVLIRFREGAVAWAADIEAMFSRIRLRPEDSRRFRFLWKRKGEEKTLTCEMKRLPFGATCSPFIAINVMRRTAGDFQASQAVKDALEKKMYVDDYLASAKTVQQGIEEAVDVNSTLSKGDFHLQGWISNSSEFLEAVSPLKRAPLDGVGLSLDVDDSEKVLGVWWNPTSDSIGFRVANTDSVLYTHAGLLSKVASVFDPQGLAAPLTVKAKIRLRLLNLKGIDWNDPVTGEDKSWWEEWFRSLSQLNNIQFPRCLFPQEENIIRSELHTFGDASEEAYAAVVYLRQVYQDGRASIHLVKAATKLAPKKAISIPKMELNASLLAARLARTVQQALTRKVHRRYFWTDSSTVRNWIRAAASSYQIFVANRIGEIQTLTEADEWRFVPGKKNPADAATRSAFGEEAIPANWLAGPDFLAQPEDSWPKDLPWMAVVEELRPAHIHHVATEEAVTIEWEKVVVQKDDLSELLTPGSNLFALLKRCQAEMYPDELSKLKRGKPLKRSSRILALTPFLAGDGLIRVGNRARRAKLSYERLHQPILPGNHPFTKKIIRAFHEQLNHSGTDLIFSYINHYIWATGGREVVKKIRRDCPTCRRYSARPGEQLMGDLPESRLEYGTPPFNNTAVDLFGPMEIGLARNRTAKRWGVLYTCLVTRAVFLDLVPSLSSDDFLLSLRRLIGLYGSPKRIHSDNGTNFVGAERELREAAEELYADETVASYFRKKSIEWTFQPPRTPHFGGAHESLVRSTKRALYQALELEKTQFRLPTEDTLRTLLFEVAGLLNLRPLTYTSSDPADFRPLTPSDFLNRPPTADPPAGTFDDANPREHYRYLQRALNLFWDLWKTVYFQSLVPRKKWKVAQRNFAVGDVVLVLDKTLGRGQWSIAHVTKIFPGAEGLVRVVDVQLPHGVFRRGINQLCLLEPVSAAQPKQPGAASGEHVPAISP